MQQNGHYAPTSTMPVFDVPQSSPQTPQLPPPPLTRPSESPNLESMPLKDTPTLSGKVRKRNPLACESCRSKKAKCDGIQPTCSTCGQRGLECVYRTFQRKAQKTEEYIKELEGRLARFEGNAPTPSPHSPSFGGSSNGLDTLSSAVHYVQSRSKDPAWDHESDENSADAADGMGVPGDKDNSTFFGKSAISTVFRSMRPSISGPSNSNDKLSPTSQPTPKSSTSLPPSLNIDDDGGLPPRTLADALLDAYWRYVHTLYPILDERSYRERYERFWADEDDTDPMELGILNLKFALGAHFLGDKLKPAEAQALGIRFFRRARDVLGARLMAGGSMRGVQALLLMGQYAQSTNQPNFCWNIIGLAVRIAQGLGLHLESTPEQGFNDAQREIRRRTFWICFVMDRMVSTTFGRPTSIREDMSSVKMPSPNAGISIVPSETISAGQPDLVHFLAATAKLSKMQGAVLDALYAQTGILTLERVPLTRLLELDVELKKFEDSLPAFLKVTTPADQIPWPSVARQRNVLRLRTLNVRILLHRPCLLQTVRDDKPRRTPSPTLDLNLEHPVLRHSAQICLEAARQTIELLHVTHRDRDRSGATWYTLYFSFQSAISILLLKMHVDKGQAVDLKWTHKDEMALDKATQIIEYLSSKSPQAATCYQYLTSARTHSVQPALPRSAAMKAPVSAPAPASPYVSQSGSYSMPAMSLGLSDTQPLYKADWPFESLFTSASLPLPYDSSSFGSTSVFATQPAYVPSVSTDWASSWPSFEMA